MTQWTSKPEADKTYANACTFFKDKTVNIESYEAASGKCWSKNNYTTANVALEILDLMKMAKSDNEALAEALQQNNEEHVFAMKELQDEMTRSKEEDQQTL